MFIENAIDGEYFITPSSLDPRFSGSNTWVKYGTSQVSLGYLGYVGWLAPANNYQDMWIDNSPIDGPFSGIRCYSGTQCPTTGYITGQERTATVSTMLRSGLSPVWSAGHMGLPPE